MAASGRRARYVIAAQRHCRALLFSGDWPARRHGLAWARRERRQGFLRDAGERVSRGLHAPRLCRGVLRRACAAHGGIRSRAAATPLSAKGSRRSARRVAAPGRGSQAARKRRVRLASAVAVIAGVVLIGILVAYYGADAVLHSLLAVGWAGFGAICVIHVGLIAVMGVAWWALLPGARLWIFIWGRLIRDAGSEVLPLAQ